MNKLYLIFLVALLLFPSVSMAEKASYKSATMRLLTDHLFQEKMIDLDDPEQFKEYTIIEDCEIFENYFSNDFEWNRIRTAVKQEMEGLSPSAQKTRIRVPGKLNITRYNFTTQAFDVSPEDVFDKVGFLQISETSYDLCDEKFREDNIEAIPNKYFLKPEVPFNLYRIPASKVVAQQVLDEVKPNKLNLRTIYIDINITLDTFFGLNKGSSSGVSADVLGTIDSVDFYTDEFRRNKFKTIYYDVY